MKKKKTVLQNTKYQNSRSPSEQMYMKYLYTEKKKEVKLRGGIEPIW